MAGTILVVQGLFLSPAAAEIRRASGTSVQLLVARELGRLGLRAGDEIATLGYPFSMYYARLARLRIVANFAFQGDDAPEETERFWALTERDRNTLNERLRQVGVKAIVSSDTCIVIASNGWHAIDGTGYCVQMLN